MNTPLEVFDGIRQAVIFNRAQFMKDLAVIYFGADLPGANIPEALLNSSWTQEMLTGFPAAYFAIKAFSATDTSEDLKRIDAATLILHGNVDKIVPVENANRSAKLLPNANPQGVSRRTSRHHLDRQGCSERRTVGLHQEVIAYTPRPAPCSTSDWQRSWAAVN